MVVDVVELALVVLVELEVLDVLDDVVDVVVVVVVAPVVDVDAEVVEVVVGVHAVVVGAVVIVISAVVVVPQSAACAPRPPPAASTAARLAMAIISTRTALALERAIELLMSPPNSGTRATVTVCAQRRKGLRPISRYVASAGETRMMRRLRRDTASTVTATQCSYSESW